MHDEPRMAEAALAAVTLAAAVCRQVQRNLDDVRRILKDDKSPVTIADYASQAIVARELTRLLGETPVLVAEETSTFLRDDDHAPHLEATLAATREVWDDCDEDALLRMIDVGCGDTHHAGFWTLDPIDGTKGFLRNQQYAIALAYVQRGEPVIGVMACPNLSRDFNAPLDEPDPVGSLYLAIRGQGVEEFPCLPPGEASRTDRARLTRPVRNEGAPLRVCGSVESAHSSDEGTEAVLAAIGGGNERVRLDSQAKYAVVARGQADAYMRLPTRKGYVERIWDHAAGALVASEAGCFVTDIHGRALDFSKGRGLEANTGILCAPAAAHGALLGAIEATQPKA